MFRKIFSRCTVVRTNGMVCVTYQLVGNNVKNKVIVENLPDFFDDPPVDLKDIVGFDCSGNRLESLPPEIEKCINLKSFDCSRNFLESLPREIGKCIRLETLSVNDNLLENLPSEIGECTQLELIDCSDNRLESLPPEIGMCTLKYLDCSRNNLESLPSEIGRCLQLTRFECSDNRLENLPPEIGKCSQLDYFLCEGNGISDEHIMRMTSILPAGNPPSDEPPMYFHHICYWKHTRKRVLTPLSNQYPNLSRKKIESLYPDAFCELIKMYIETGEIQTTDLPRQKSAGKV